MIPVLHDPAGDEPLAHVLAFGGRLVVGLTLVGWMAWQGFVPAFFATVQASLPPIGRPHVAALLVPLGAYLWSASLIALALSRARTLRTASWRTRVRVGAVCVGVGLVGGALVYAGAGSVLPRHSRPPQLRGGMPLDQAVGMSPHLLTNRELMAVEAFVSAQGGQLAGPALMRQARLWCASLPPLFGLLTAIALVRSPARRALLHALALEALALVCFMAASGSTMVIATSRRPRTALLPEGWLLLATLAGGAMWWAWNAWHQERRT